jgi:radical SAM superfamily enzyme YgiQ (UPF0313 family)
MRIIFSVEDLFVIEPLGIMQMIAIAKKHGHQCFFAPYRTRNFLPLVRKINPDLVAISIMSISDLSCRTIIKEIKKINPQILVLVGGSHPTFYPEFINKSETDAICVGEGDGAFADLLQAWELKKPIVRIPNIYTKTSKNPPRLLEPDLDRLPFADRDLVYQNSLIGQMKMKSFMATRGCPYTCSYCFNSAYKKLYLNKGPVLRRRSVNNLIEEIEWVQANYPLEMVHFGDDNFVEGVTDWLKEFVDQYPRRVKLPFYCLLRPNVVTPQLARLIKKAGCVSVATSIETGNEQIRQQILNRKVTDKQIIKACRTLVDHGIKTYTNIMIGLPETTISDEIKSLELATESKTTYAASTIFTPFPGTELNQYCLDKNYLPKAKKIEFPRSTTDRSMLNCFSEKEKDIQRNILLLGALANNNKVFRFIIMRWLIYLPPNQLFFYLSFLVRNYYLYRHIYPLKLNVWEFIQLVRLVRQYEHKYIE